MRFRYEELAHCAKRELALRKRVYPRLIEEGKLTRADAERELALMSDIQEYFETQRQPKLL